MGGPHWSLYEQGAVNILWAMTPRKRASGGRPITLYEPGLEAPPATVMEWSRSTKLEKPRTRQRRLLREFSEATPFKAQVLGPPPELAVAVERESATMPKCSLTGAPKRQRAAAIYLRRTMTNHADAAHTALAFAILQVGGRLGVQPVPRGNGRIDENYGPQPGSARAYVTDVLAVLYPPGKTRTPSPLPGVKHASCWPAAFREAAAQLRAVQAKTLPEYMP